MKNTVLSLILLVVANGQLSAQDDVLIEVESALADANYSYALQESEKAINSGAADSTLMCLFYAFAGIASEELGDLPKAVNYYKKAIDYKVPRLDVYEKLKVVAKNVGDLDSYEFALLKQGEEFPDFRVDVLMSLASHYYKTKQYNKLTAVCDEMLSMYPDEVKYVYYKAIAAQKTGEPEEAKALYKKAIALDSEHSGANIALGVLLYKEASSQYKKETKMYEAKAKPSHVEYHEYIQRLDLVKEVHRESLPYLLKGYELKPSANLKALIKNTYKRLGEEDKANQF